MNVIKLGIVCAGLLAATVGTHAARAADAGDWLWRVGAHSVRPKSDNHDVVNVDSATTLTFNATRLITPNWGVELLAALPFEHDINLNGGGKVASTKHLPPTLSVQYHFMPAGTVRPYAGLGLNYTLFFDEKTRGALAGTDLKLQDSFGLAAQLGVDVSIGNDWFVNVDARWLDIDAKAKVDGTSIGKVHIDPFAYGVSVGRRF